MSKCIIFYVSRHHRNTETLLRQAAGGDPFIQLTSLPANTVPDLSQYDFIGFASGIYMGKPHTELLSFLEEHRSELTGRKIFTLLTSGSNQPKYGTDFRSRLEALGCRVTGSYQCRGFDTYGPWKFIGGIAKGHPDTVDIAKAAAFIREQIHTALPGNGDFTVL